MKSVNARRLDDDEPAARPSLRAVEGSESQLASAGDREMMAAAAAAVALISAKWKVELLFLLAAQVRRHSRLQDHLLVSKKVLSDTLKSLVRDGLVSRTVYAELPVRVEYSLTPLGRSLTAPLFALYEWMDERAADVHAAREEFDRCNGRSTEIDRTATEPPRFSASFGKRERPTLGPAAPSFARFVPSRRRGPAASSG